MNLPPIVAAFADWHANQFRNAEHADVYMGRTPRDPALIQSVIEALCDGACPWAAGVMDYVDRRRAGMEPT